MLIQDTFQLAHELSDKTHVFLTKHQISPSPANYAVIYLHVSKRNVELTQTINERVKNKEILDSSFIESLFDQFLSNAENIKNNILTPFDDTINETLSKLESQVANGHQVVSNLQKADKVLNSGQHHERQNHHH